MIGTLRIRLVLASVAVLLLALLAAALLLRQGANHEMGLLAMGEMHERHLRLQRELQDYWQSHRSWIDVEPVLADMERLTGFRVGIASHGQVIAVSSGTTATASVWHHAQDFGDNESPNSDLAVRDSDGSLAGTLVFLGRVSGVGTSAGAAARLDRWIALVLLSVAGVAFGLTLLLTRTITGPLEELTSTVRSVGAGDRNRRARLRSRDEIGALAAAFDDLMDRLAQQEQLRQELVSDVAHELRTPLHNLRGELEAAADGLIRKDSRLVDSLQEEVRHLSALVSDLEQLALADAGQMRIAPVPIPASQLIERAVAGCATRARERRVAMRAELEASLTLRVDPERMVQVLRNLIENAIRHSPPDSEIHVAARNGAEVTILEVIDAGEGIAAADLPRVFDRLFRADSSRARATGGAGLGLAIVKQIVELHGGSVAAQSVPGVRTSFTVTLPQPHRA